MLASYSSTISLLAINVPKQLQQRGDYDHPLSFLSARFSIYSPVYFEGKLALARVLTKIAVADNTFILFHLLHNKQTFSFFLQLCARYIFGQI